MMKRLWLYCVCLFLVAGSGLTIGCGGGGESRGAAQSPSGGGEAQSYGGVSAQSESRAKSGPPTPIEAAPASAPADFSPGAHADSTEPARSTPPRERQGLGTEWGESRVSRVHDVAFVRADHDRPTALAQIYYNDQSGVDALSAYHQTRGPRLRQIDALDGAVSVSVRDGSGDSLESLRVGDRSYVVGQAGQRYTIVLENHTGHRFETVATVDGLDVINGKTGSLDNRGYVLLPYATLEIDGFRQSQDAVASFRFGAVGDSYAAQTGTARNVGVIGIAFFGERGDAPVTERELRTRDTANPFPGSDPRFAQPPRH